MERQECRSPMQAPRSLVLRQSFHGIADDADETEDADKAEDEFVVGVHTITSLK